MEQGKISSKQAFYLITTFIIATTFLGFPALVAGQAGKDAWLSSLIATLLSYPTAWLTVKLGSLFPGLTLIEYIEKIIGIWPGKMLGFLYLFYFFHICSGIITEYGGFIADVFMPETPTVVFFIVPLIIAAYIIKFGLEVLARTNQIFFPWLVLSLPLILVFVIPEMKIERFLPVFDSSPLQIFKGTLAPLTWHGEIIAFAMIIPYLSKPKEAAKIAYISLALIGVIFLLLIATSLAVFGSTVSSMLYPVLNVARVIKIDTVIDRPEPVLMAIWVSGGVIKIACFYYIIVLGTAQLFKLKDYRPLVLPVGLILLALSINFAPNTIMAFDYIAYYWPFYGLIFELGLMLTLFFIALIRSKEGSSGDQKNN
ncbi:spore germination protein KB [Desulfotomaculum arcticum]|uniref:Spore germination protein KB n=1 Tax=Desulfotruncus arcticus DSM 17038 TaxID=1121424 RepID=A0A1I2XE47_9FIRM|nr:endospore germination permease [Desulfotruncus arcticus]SFH11814.1 spore germination protein KB [Desulfotomaculum arcticum] [Desulfotruncus arcticus DSM 17038]